jgi:ribonuclease HII
LKFRAIQQWYQLQPHCIAGVDEAGRGPLAGPVVACAVDLPKDHGIIGLNDSKILSAETRQKLSPLIQQRAIACEVGVVSVEVIDSINILQATLLAMRQCIEKIDEKMFLVQKMLMGVLIDGNRLPPMSMQLKAHAIVDGDALFEPIMAASIVAKHTRDCIMQDYDKQFPLYGFAQHKGYATKSHRDKILRFGPCAIHRKTFSPIKEILSNAQQNPSHRAEL